MHLGDKTKRDRYGKATHLGRGSPAVKEQMKYKIFEDGTNSY